MATKRVVKRKPVHKSEWNVNLTDDDKYKLPREEMLRRKKLYISKHNILTSSPNTLLSGKSGKRRQAVRVRKTPTKNPLDDSEVDEDDLSTTLDDITSLDLLTGDEDAQKCVSDGFDNTKARKKTPAQRHPRLLRSPQQQQPPQKQQQTHNHTLKPPDHSTPTHSPIKMSKTSRKISPQVQSSAPHRHPATTSPVTEREKEAKGARAKKADELSLTQREMKDIGAMVDMLHHEVNYYEQLTGKKSAIDVEVRPAAATPSILSIYYLFTSSIFNTLHVTCFYLCPP